VLIGADGGSGDVIDGGGGTDDCTYDLGDTIRDCETAVLVPHPARRDRGPI
jgi:hypothetical protein